MYCKHCGTQIDDDSIYCNKCGKKQNIEKKQDTDIIKNDKKPYKATAPGCFIFIIILCFLVTLTIITLVENNKNSNDNSKDSTYEDNIPQLFTRNARNSDLTITTETNYSNLGVDIIIMPKTDIEDLEIKLVHYDKNGNELLTQYKTIGNVKEGVQVKTQVQLLDFSFTDMFKVYNTEIYVTEGTVSYFQ